MVINTNIDKKTAKKIVVEKKLNESLSEHKHFQVVNFRLDSISRSRSKYLI